MLGEAGGGEDIGVPAARRSPLTVARWLLAAARPRQWPKNLFVYAALVFTDSWRSFGLVTAAFGLFCLVSSAVYLLNDVIDREQDRLHPEKRLRPIASGQLPWQAALASATVAAAAGVTASFLLGARFGWAVVAYIGLQVAYTLALKREVLVDVFAIAGGFVLRAVAGAYVLGVPNSVWLLVCTFQLALFMGFGKRRHELVTLEHAAGNHRRTLSRYSLPFLDQMIAIVLAGLIVSYALYTITSPTSRAHQALIATLPSVMYGCFRYLYLIHIEHRGGSPEAILLEDRPMQINLLVWLTVVVLAFRAG